MAQAEVPGQRGGILLAKLRELKGSTDGIYLVGLGLTALAFYLLPATSLSLLALLGFVLISAPRPRLALVLVIFSLPFYLRPREIGDLQFSPTEALLLASAVGWAAGRLWQLRPGVRPLRSTALDARMEIARTLIRLPGFLLPTVLFLAAALLSLSAAEQLREGLRALRTVVVEPMLLCALVLVTGGGRQQANRLVGALILAAVAVSLIGFYQYLFTADVITADDVRRIKVFYGSPNHLGLFLGRVAPLAVALAVFYPVSRLLYAAVAGVILVAIGLTFSVGAWAGVTGGILLVVCLAGRRVQLAALVMGTVAALGLAGLGVLQSERVTSHFSFDSGTNALRLQLWQSAVNMLRDHPVLGVGLDNFIYHYQTYAVGEVAWREPTMSHPHNLVLDFWLSTGLLGLMAIIWLLWWFFSRSAMLWRSRDNPVERALLVGVMGSMADMLIHGLIDNSYFLVDLAFIFWLSLALVGLMAGTTANSEREEDRRDNPGGRRGGLHRLASL